MPKRAIILLAALLPFTPFLHGQQGQGSLIGQGPNSSTAESDVGVGRPAPPWHNRSWLNADAPVTLESLRGRVILLNFWTFTCYNCTGAIPSMVDFDRRYREQGLTVVGIHSPEFPPYGGEHDRANVAQALTRYAITYPNAQDNDHATWDLYGIRYWPSFTLIDRAGRIRYEGYGEFHVGDASYEEWDGRIRKLLEEH
jgi:thiol-disulfide isomerase/thioredoxin